MVYLAFDMPTLIHDKDRKEKVGTWSCGTACTCKQRESSMNSLLRPSQSAKQK